MTDDNENCGDWQVWLRAESEKPIQAMFFHLIKARDIGIAEVIARDMASRGRYELVGISPLLKLT